jgi:glycosyltransferase A (GT-A) superfamily protein (DUF2064 family)
VQRGADLGQRLAAAVTDAFADGAGPLLVIGIDAPTLTADHLTAALSAPWTAKMWCWARRWTAGTT